MITSYESHSHEDGAHVVPPQAALALSDQLVLYHGHNEPVLLELDSCAGLFKLLLEVLGVFLRCSFFNC